MCIAKLLRIHVWCTVTWIPFWDRRRSLKQMLRRYTPRRPFRPYRGLDCEMIVDVVLHRLHRPRMMRRRACYRQGLALFYFLRLAGFAPILHFGVHPPSTDEKRLHAHCWVSLSGQVLAEPTPKMPDLFRYDGTDTEGWVEVSDLLTGTGHRILHTRSS